MNQILINPALKVFPSSTIIMSKLAKQTNQNRQTTQRKDNRKYQNYYVGRKDKNNNIDIKEQKTTT